MVLEKGSEVGAHILSGAVLDPCGLDALIPDWRERDAPVTVPEREDNFHFLTAKGGMRIPNCPMPPLMSNHGAYIVSMGNVCRWMARQAEDLGIEIFPGMACSALVYGEDGEVKGVIAGEFGRAADGSHGPAYEPGMELHGKYVFLGEGVRGSLAKKVITTRPDRGTGVRSNEEDPARGALHDARRAGDQGRVEPALLRPQHQETTLGVRPPWPERRKMALELRL